MSFLNLMTLNTSALLDGLEEEKYDLVLCSYQENRNNINFVPITTEELVVVVSKLNPLALKNEIDLQELQNEYFIYYSKHSGLRPLIDDIFHSNNIDPNIMFEVEEGSAIPWWVCQEKCVSFFVSFFTSVNLFCYLQIYHHHF